ncbi:hypothetical protein AVEN_242396-1 [Araneus ventricosus]|uniref:Uncharacterized protein n=1 Tax=Araneus ventricosus TaxID=182803 RepID=A0A4Y2MED6_ARAVE|nr:hypothetical protein AVEN_242396-1 [Araneus ventricosus]
MILVNSSSVDRCLRSAEALVAAFYAPQGIWKFEEDLNWQPIPVHYLPAEKDKYLSFASFCPRSVTDSKRLYNSRQVQEVFQKHKHDNNLGAMLLALNFTNMPRPPYSATLLFELHKMADNTNAVRLLYLNSTRPEIDLGKPHVLVLEGCSEYCPLVHFERKVEHFIPENWDQECQLEHESP